MWRQRGNETRGVPGAELKEGKPAVRARKLLQDHGDAVRELRVPEIRHDKVPMELKLPCDLPPVPASSTL